MDKVYVVYMLWNTRGNCDAWIAGVFKNEEAAQAYALEQFKDELVVLVDNGTDLSNWNINTAHLIASQQDEVNWFEFQVVERIVK